MSDGVAKTWLLEPKTRKQAAQECRKFAEIALATGLSHFGLNCEGESGQWLWEKTALSRDILERREYCAMLSPEELCLLYLFIAEYLENYDATS